MPIRFLSDNNQQETAVNSKQVTEDLAQLSKDLAEALDMLAQGKRAQARVRARAVFNAACSLAKSAEDVEPVRALANSAAELLKLVPRQ